MVYVTFNRPILVDDSIIDYTISIKGEITHEFLDIVIINGKEYSSKIKV